MTEKDLHTMVAKWLKAVHPRLIFRSDFGAGIRLTIGQAVKQKELQSSRAYPDLFIAEPRGPYHGMFIELKKDRDAVWDKKGRLRRIQHIAEQHVMLERLKLKGYHACFGLGFEDTISKITDYLNQE